MRKALEILGYGPCYHMFVVSATSMQVAVVHHSIVKPSSVHCKNAAYAAGSTSTVGRSRGFGLSLTCPVPPRQVFEDADRSKEWQRIYKEIVAGNDSPDFTEVFRGFPSAVDAPASEVWQAILKQYPDVKVRPDTILDRTIHVLIECQVLMRSSLITSTHL